MRRHYVDHRKEIGCPYNGISRNNGVDFNPEFSDKDFIFLSLGGNDFALRGEMDPVVILAYVRQVIEFYISKGVKRERIFYFPPYPPTGLMKFAVCLRARKSLGTIYEQCLDVAQKECAAQGITCIMLDHFGDNERANPGTGIPEPTPYGAYALAKLIQEHTLKQIEKEESQ